ncbi:helix-turn-helix transcriptional regulator [Burkholderia seminalis]|uniref:helix-turn-helix transcriptional regulator n=1 Tax=Burkholderia seminalis TaxID=488731 RepID=UPI00145490B7|nr:AlpA family phage regulatory protein [Burkholderia seminalis]MCA8435348.1 AlpA family phage regulatory protein [Burkholderia seminalis]VWC35782.1 hypothetical protein BSE24067_06675 [Burkholderia seminalis]
MQEPTIPFADRCLRPKAAAAKLGISVSTLFRYAKNDPAFPKGIKMSTACTLYRESELERYLSFRAAHQPAVAA